jgi:hypothetical protein
MVPDTPVVKHSSIRTFLSLVVVHDYELEQLDVKTAFLHGDLEEDIYMLWFALVLICLIL